jgi:hypothetical protein
MAASVRGFSRWILANANFYVKIYLGNKGHLIFLTFMTNKWLSVFRKKCKFDEKIIEINIMKNVKELLIDKMTIYMGLVAKMWYFLNIKSKVKKVLTMLIFTCIEGKYEKLPYLEIRKWINGNISTSCF